mgnify:CR=1 FL=1
MLTAEQCDVYNGDCRTSRQELNVVYPIRRDRLLGMTYSQIAEKYQIDPRTAKRYAEKNLPTDYLEHRPFPSVLDPFKSEIDQWLKETGLTATEVWNRLKKRGCQCGYTIVNDYVRKSRQNHPYDSIPIEMGTNKILPETARRQIK